MNAMTTVARFMEVAAVRIEVLAEGGLYGRLMFCLKQYPRSFGHVLHIATTAAGQPEIYRDLQDNWPFAPNDDKRSLDLYNMGVMRLLKENENKLSRSYPWAKYLPWIAKELAVPKFGETTTIVSFLLGSFKRFFEYVRKLPGDVSKLKLIDVVKAVEEQMANEPNPPPPQGETVYTYGDKWTIQKLTTKDQLDAEGELLQHCVGSYFNAVADGKTSIYSLRDPDGFPHVTTEYRDGRIVQIQAKGNQFPEKHLKRLREMVMNVFDGNIVDRIMLREDPKTLPLAGADLQRAELPLADLQGANLQRADLYAADLRVAKLQGADLRGVKLQTANLQRANLQRANLQEADLQRAKLQYADIQEANLQRANLYAADLQGAELQMADLQGANLQRANLRSAKLQEANLQEANLRSAKLQEANLQRANLQGADLQKADLYAADLQGANLQGANLQWTELQWAKLQGADLRGADLRGAGADLRGANFQNAKWDENTKWPEGYVPDKRAA